MTVTHKYRHDNQNSIYYLKPGSTDIFFLDFGRQSFLQEQLNWKRGQGLIPHQMSSVQTSDTNILVVGGCSGSEQNPLSDCLLIDGNLTVYEREKMKTARFSAVLALIRDRFVLAMGGMTGKTTATHLCEAFDI